MIRQLCVGSEPSPHCRSLVDRIQELRRRVWIAKGAGTDIRGADDLDLAPDTVHFFQEAGGRILAAARVTVHQRAVWRPDPRFGPLRVPNRVRRIAVMSHLVVDPACEKRGWATALDKARIAWARRHAHMVLVEAPRQRINKLLRERFQVVQMHSSGPPPFEWQPTTWAALSRVFSRRWVVWSLTAFGAAAGLGAFVLTTLAAKRGNVVPLAVMLVALAVIGFMGRRSPWLLAALAIEALVGWDRSLLVALVGCAAVIEVLHRLSPKGTDVAEDWPPEPGEAAVAGAPLPAMPLRESGVVRQAWQERPILMNIAALLVCWITATLLVRFDTPSFSLPTPHRRDTRRDDVAMAMSGGGYRAALFHMGVLHELERNEVQPQNGGAITKLTPGVVSAVSGGAIAAGYFACGGSPSTFLETFSAERLTLPRQILRADHLVRLAVGGMARVDVHAELLGQELLGETRMRDAARFDPALLLCTTDLLSGDLVGWGNSSCIVHSPPAMGPASTSYLDYVENLWWRLYSTGRPVISAKTVLALHIGDDDDYGNAPLSRLVAASAAFPGVFDPLQLSLSCADQGNAREPGQRFELVDGGVLDNSGLSLLLAAIWRSTQSPDGPDAKTYAAYRGVKTILECDASQTIESSLTPTNTVSSLLRSGDLVHSDASTSSRQRLAAEARRLGLQYVLISPYQLWRNRPIQGTTSLQEPIEASPVMRAFSDIANRIYTERGLHANTDDRSWVLDILQQALINLAVRHFVAWQRPEVLLAMLDVAGIDHPSLTVAELSDRTLPRERSQLRGVEDLPRERLLSLGDEQLCRYLGRTVHRFQSVPLEQLYDDVRNCYYEFRNMSTLVDEAPPQQAARVFRLGRYILLANIDAIHRALAPR